jgi:hypothetical protein
MIEILKVQKVLNGFNIKWKGEFVLSPWIFSELEKNRDKTLKMIGENIIKEISKTAKSEIDKTSEDNVIGMSMGIWDCKYINGGYITSNPTSIFKSSFCEVNPQFREDATFMDWYDWHRWSQLDGCDSDVEFSAE